MSKIELHEFYDDLGGYYIGFPKSKISLGKVYKRGAYWNVPRLKRVIIEFKSTSDRDDYFKENIQSFQYSSESDRVKLRPPFFNKTRREILTEEAKENKAKTARAVKSKLRSDKLKIKKKIRKGTFFGYGINDSLDPVSWVGSDGDRVICPYYTAWYSMINRCYSEITLNKNPSYIEVTVCDDWLKFSNFKKWMIQQDWKGKTLDKDLLKVGNKIYSPDTCIFLPHNINCMVCYNDDTLSITKKGTLYIDGKYIASCSIGNKAKYLGTFKTEKEAYTAYVKARSAYIREVADTQEERIKNGLYRHAKALEDTLKQG